MREDAKNDTIGIILKYNYSESSDFMALYKFTLLTYILTVAVSADDDDDDDDDSLSA